MQTIGRSMPMISKRGESSPSTPQPSTPLPRSSVTTGEQNPARTGSNPIGAPLGGTGSKTISAITELGRGLRADNPMATDRALRASLPPGLLSCLEWKMGLDFDRTEAVMWKATPRTEEAMAMVRSAAQVVRSSMQPTTPNEVVALLTRLHTETKARPEHEFDLQAKLQIYTENIIGYPGDVVRHVLRSQSSMGVFWPAWAELKDRLEMHTSYRARLLHALENPPKIKPKAAASEPYRAPERPTKPAEAEETEEEFEARKRRMIIEKFSG